MSDDPSHKQKSINSLTEMSISLVPVLAQPGAWGRRFLPASRELSTRARLLEEGGTEMWEQFMDELRAENLGKRAKHEGLSVAEKLQSAYELKLKEKNGRQQPPSA